MPTETETTDTTIDNTIDVADKTSDIPTDIKTLKEEIAEGFLTLLDEKKTIPGMNMERDAVKKDLLESNKKEEETGIFNKMFSKLTENIKKKRTAAKEKLLSPIAGTGILYTKEEKEKIKTMKSYLKSEDKTTIDSLYDKVVVKKEDPTIITTTTDANSLDKTAAITTGAAVTGVVATDIIGSSTDVAPFKDMKDHKVGTYGWRTDPFDATKQQFHEGIDISGTESDPILSMTAGKVFYAGDANDGFGNKVIIEDADGKKILYAHMSKISVSESDTITAGQELGFVGKTGLATGDHLHLAVIKKDGTYEDPTKDDELKDLLAA